MINSILAVSDEEELNSSLHGSSGFALLQSKVLTHYTNLNERSSQVVFREWSHDLTGVRLDNSTKNWDSSRDLGLNQESEDTQHSKTSVVDLDLKSTGLGFLTLLLAESKRIVKVEWDRVGKRVGVEVRVVTWLSSSHVVLVGFVTDFTPDFQEGNEAEDLPLGGITDFVPKLRRVGVVRERSSIHLHGPWELDSVGVDNVSNEGEHSNTSVPASKSDKIGRNENEEGNS